MDFLISSAWAQAAPQPQAGNPFEMLVLFGVLFAMFYFLMIRPQVKKQKEHREMLGKLAKGDEAVTAGGLLGRVKEVGDNFVLLEVAKGVEVKIQKSYVQAVLPKGTLKTS
ncbi:MAG: preprotein translocase subunit YajC [Gammaproteobacteria bacterium]